MNKVLLLLIVSYIFFLSGCGFKDIDKRFFAVSIGIDKSENDAKSLKVSLKLAIPPEETGKSAEFEIYSEEGETITEAIEKIKSKIDKELDLGLVKVIILGEKIVEEDIGLVLDWFERHQEVQKIAWVAIGNPSAVDVLKVKPKSERIPSNTLILSFGEAGTESQYIVSQELFRLSRSYFEKGVDPILPIVEAKKDYFLIEKAGVLSKGVLKLTLTKEETKMFKIITEGLEKTNFRLVNNNNLIMVAADKARAKYFIQTPLDQQPFIQMDINVNGSVEEQKSRKPITNEGLDKYEKIGEQDIKDIANLLLSKLQKESVDPIGFGVRYRSRHWEDPKTEWKDWKAIYPKLQFRINTYLNVKSTGITK